MALDKETVLNTSVSLGLVQEGEYTVEDIDEEAFKFAKAIYEIGYGDGASNDINAQTNYNRGVNEERERIAKQFDEAGWHPYTEAIRNSNNARKGCDSKSDS